MQLTYFRAFITEISSKLGGNKQHEKCFHVFTVYISSKKEQDIDHNFETIAVHLHV